MASFTHLTFSEKLLSKYYLGCRCSFLLQVIAQDVNLDAQDSGVWEKGYLEGASPGRWGRGRKVGQGKICCFTVLADAFLKLWGTTSVSAAFSLGSVLLQEPRRGHILKRFLGERKGGWIYLLASLPSPFYLGKTIYHEVPNSTSLQDGIFHP